VTETEGELQAMLTQAQRQSPGPARWTALDAVFRHADAAENLQFGFQARLTAMEDLHDHGEWARMLMAFSWCLDTFDRHPEATGPNAAFELLWRYKWVIWQATQFPGIRLDRLEALLADMRRRYLEGGHSLHAVYQHEGLVAHHRGDSDAAEHWYAEMALARRDRLSDCVACVPTDVVAHLVACGRDVEALAMGTPYLTGGCSEQPDSMISELLLPYLRTGRFDEAVTCYLRAYNTTEDKRGLIEWIGRGLEFCALTGNEEYALPTVQRYLPWLERPASPYAAKEFAVAAAQVLGRLEVAGKAQAPLARRSDDGTRRWESTIEATRAELVGLARRIAAEFDARNGNDHHAAQVEARLTMEPFATHLPLTILRGRAIPVSEGRAALDPLEQNREYLPEA
jgi:hypothetical protein